MAQELKNKIPVIYRKARELDLSFVYATWLKSQRRQGDNALMTNTVYFKGMSEEITNLISRSDVILIANPEDLNHVFGWVSYRFIGDLLIIHYAYVKKMYQRMGLMSDLLKEIYPKFGNEFVAITAINDLIAMKRTKYHLTFNPYLKDMYHEKNRGYQ